MARLPGLTDVLGQTIAEFDLLGAILYKSQQYQHKNSIDNVLVPSLLTMTRYLYFKIKCCYSASIVNYEYVLCFCLPIWQILFIKQSLNEQKMEALKTYNTKNSPKASQIKSWQSGSFKPPLFIIIQCATDYYFILFIVYSYFHYRYFVSKEHE